MNRTGADPRFAGMVPNPAVATMNEQLDQTVAFDYTSRR